jgi:serine kinase
MRFAENGDLYEYISKHGPMAESHARLWFRQVALAVKYFHSLQLGHRDIKCENILITKKMNAKLSDFGFCRSCVAKDGTEKLSDTYCGSLLYASPEVLRGKPYKIRPADIWSLGVVLFVMVNGTHPFVGKRVKEILQQQIEKNYQWEPRVNASVTLKKLVDSMFDPDVRTRATIDQVLNSQWMKKDPRVMELVPDIS